MKWLVLVALVVSQTAYAGWPVIGKFSAKSANAKAAAFRVETSANPDTGEIAGRAGIDLAAIGDEDSGWFDASAGGFFKDLGVYSVVGVALYYGYKGLDRYLINKEKYEDSGEPATRDSTGQGDVILGQGTTVNGSVDTLGGDVVTGRGTTINGSINTGPQAPSDF